MNYEHAKDCLRWNYIVNGTAYDDRYCNCAVAALEAAKTTTYHLRREMLELRDALMLARTTAHQRGIAMHHADRHVLAAQQLVRELLAEVPDEWTEIPATCGACGTPNANCDMNCVTAHDMAEHNALLRRAKRFIGK